MRRGRPPQIGETQAAARNRGYGLPASFFLFRISWSRPVFNHHPKKPMYDHILLCTHGSPGARKAEDYVFGKLLSHAPAAGVTVLTIIDRDWTLMTGDDWLNTSRTRNTFLEYVDDQLGREIAADWQRIRKSHSSAAGARFMKVVGHIEETIVAAALQEECDLIVVGGRRNKPRRLTSVTMEPGLAARLRNEKLHPLLPVPLLVVGG